MGKETFEFINKNIVIVSPEQWGNNLLSKHHIALALAKKGNCVWFVAPSAYGFDNQIQSPFPNVHLISHKSFPGLNVLPNFIARLIARLDVRSLLRKIEKPIDVVWSFDPYRYQFLKLFGASISIYHPVDYHNTDLEKRIVEEADLVVSNTDITLAKFIRPNKFKLGHGISSHFFEPTSSIDLPGNFQIKVGYVGNLNNRFFDFDLFVNLVAQYPNVGFYLIGPRGSSNLSASKLSIFDWSKLEKARNFCWLGEQSSAMIPSFISRMDILLVLYKPDTNGVTVNPHKILEYLSSGKLVITPRHEENQPIKDLILEVDSLFAMVDMLNYAISNLDKFLTPTLKAARVAIALTMTYEKRLNELEQIIENFKTKA
jgi:hypothetical protein